MVEGLEAPSHFLFKRRLDRIQPIESGASYDKKNEKKNKTSKIYSLFDSLP